MRNLTLLLLLLAVCAASFSKDLRKRRSYSNEDTAVLQALLKDIDDGNVDLNDLLKDVARNPDRRLWIRWPRLPWPFGKK